MKISNSKKQLAEIIHKNGGWREKSCWAAQDKQYCGRKNNVGFYDAKPPRPGHGSSCWGGHSGALVHEFEATELTQNWHQTILSRDEYFSLYPVAETAPEPVVEAKPTIEQLAADYRNRKDYADRKQQEADAAKADAEAKLVELVAAGEALGLVLSVARVAHEPPITDWLDLQEGDEIKVFDFENPEEGAPRKSELMGGVCVVMRARGGVVHIELKDNLPKVGPYWNATGVDKCNFTFIRRPAKGDANA